MILSEKPHQNISSFYFKKYLNLIKNGNISIEKMRNSGNRIYEYAHSFFGKDFQNKTLYRVSFKFGKIKLPLFYLVSNHQSLHQE